jgi:hypothetical protein
MNLTTRRRLSRLEKRVASVVAERKQREPEVLARQRQAALYHAAKLATLIVHGDPQIDEPLAIAWERALGHLGLSGTPQELLYYRLRAALGDLPGDTEIAKFAHIFRSAPSWLLCFCKASLDCFVLGIELPKSSEPWREYGRDGLREADDAWPDLPKGTIGAGRPIPKSNPWLALSYEEGMDLIRLRKIGEENWLRRDRHRYGEIMAKVDRGAMARWVHQQLDEGVTDEK